MKTTINNLNCSEVCSEPCCTPTKAVTDNKKIFSLINKKIILFLSAFFMLFFIPQNSVAQLTDIELDGNAFDNPIIEGEDWNLVYAGSSGASVTTGVVSDLNNIFTTGGSKDDLDIPEWRWSAAELIPDKDDILHAGFALYGDDKLYFFADRYAVNGDASLGFWLFKSQVSINFDGTFSGIHTVGDILIVSHFSNGGGVSTIYALKWVGTGGNATANGTLQYITLSAAGGYAITNSSEVPSPWPYTPKSGTAGVFPVGAFMEGGIDLGVLLPQGIDPCFASFLAETRSSTSVDAQLKDFVNGAFNTKPLVSVNSATRCINGSAVTLIATVNGGVPPVSYLWSNGATTSSITVSPDQTTVYTVTVTGHNGCIANPVSGTVTVNPNPVCSINEALNPEGIPQITCNSPGGSPGNTISTSNVDAGNSYVWSFLSPPAGWSITGGQGTNQITFTSGECAASVTVQLVITDANGCSSTCTSIITPIPFDVSCDANAGANKLLNCTITSVQLEGSTLTPSFTADDGTVYQSLYSWAGPGIVSGGNTLNPTVNAMGSYTLTVTVMPGTALEQSCSAVVFVDQDITPPACSISGIDPTCIALSNVYSGPAAPQGRSYSYSWALIGSVNASISGALDGQSVTVISGSCNASYTLQLTVTDLSNGCVSVCTEDFGYIDDVAPIIGNPGANATIDCPAEPVFSAPTATDACSSATVTEVSDVTVGDGCNYTRTKTWKAVDACGNESGTVSQAITVHDITAPLIGAAGSNTIINCPSEPVFTPPTGSDECSTVEIIKVSDVTVGDACNYTRTISWKAVDDCSNESNLVSQAITVRDITAPLIDNAVASSTISCPSLPVFTVPGGSDECSTFTVVEVSDNTVGGACNYTRTKTWHAVDNCGNISRDVSQSITVRDITAPTIGAAGSNTIINCPSLPVFTPPTGADECSSVQIVEVSDNTVGGACDYTRTKTWKAVDACGNESGLVSQAITVRDVTAPTIGAAGSNTIINCPSIPVFTPPTGADECSSVQIVEVSDNTVGGACDYTRTKTWKAVDACGNESGLVSQAITVHDVTAPLINNAVASSTLNCPAQPVFTVPGGSDECSTFTVVEVSDVTVGGACNYTRTKTWHAIDNCGNISRDVSQAITVHDITAPSIGAAGSNVTLDCPSQPVFSAPTATDACSSATVIEVSDVTVGGACNYTRTKTWKAVDACGNESGTVSQAITVHDITAPLIGAAGSNTIINCPSLPVFTAPTGSDECSTFTVVEVSDNTVGGACNYTRTKTWKAVDACGNESNLVSQAITVRDITAPLIDNAVASSTISCPSLPVFTVPGGSDECSTFTVVEVSDNTVGGACNYTRTKTWHAVDNCGNISRDVSQSITVRDITAPTIGAAGSNTIINCPSLPVFTPPTGADECSSVQIVEVSDNTIGGACDYTRTKTWKAVDACGNESGLVSQAITVRDVTAPSIGAAGSDITLNCPAQPIFTPPTGADECSQVSIVEVSDNTVGGSCNYTRTKTWKAVDACGNESGLVSQAITVRDITAPSISGAGSDMTLNCPAQPIFTPPTGSDECSSIQIVEISDITVGSACNYTRTKTWKAVDACGNESNLVSQAITVRDITAPSITAAGPNMTLDCPALPVFTEPKGDDECSEASIVEVSDVTVGGSCNYTRTKTWKAVDACGNESNLVSQAITVHDVTAPSIGAAGANTILECPEEPIFTAPSGSDECSQVTIVEVSDNTVGGECNYVRTKTWKAVDACGNESGLVSQAITVRDITAPVIVCPADETIVGSGGDESCIDLGGGGIATVTEKANKFPPIANDKVDFRQPRNENHPQIPLDWTNAVNNITHAEYFEGMGVPQRVIFTGLTPGTHVFKFRHEAVKHQSGDYHAYDFLMSWDQAIATAGNIGNGSVNELQNLLAQTCNGQISATAGNACSNLSSISDEDPRIQFASPTDFMGNPPNHHGNKNVNDVIAAFENVYGDRKIEIRGNAAITNFNITFDGYSGKANGDNYAWYTVTWTSSSSEVLIKLAGRAAAGADPALGYGACYGAGSINGAPYHFKLETLDSHSLGNRDNQLMVEAPICILDVPLNFGTPSVTDCDPNPIITVVDSNLVTNQDGGSKTTCRKWSAIDRCGNTSECQQCITVVCPPNQEILVQDETEVKESIILNAIPNPFDSKTSLEFISSFDTKVKIEVFSITGAKVATLFNDEVKANEARSVMFDGQSLSNGIYIYVLTTNEKAYYHKLLLAR